MSSRSPFLGDPESIGSPERWLCRLSTPSPRFGSRWEGPTGRACPPRLITGIYGYPLEPATAIAVTTCRAAPPEIELIRFVCFDDQTLAAYERELSTT